MLSYEERLLIEKATKDLTKNYPTEANYSSRASLWGCGLKDGIVTKELYDSARTYYGRLWHYVGD